MSAPPPGPTAAPMVQMWHWIRNPYGFLEDCHLRYGHTFTVRFAGFSPVVFSADPAFAHAVFTADPDQLRAGEGNDVLLPFVGPNSLLTMDGARHRRDRKLMTPPFHGARMRAYGAIVQDAAARAISGWGPGRADTRHAMQAVSLEVILRAVFGIDEPGKLEDARKAISELVDGVGGPLIFAAPLRTDLGPWSPWGKFLRRKATFERLMDGEIERRRKEPGEDILSLLLAARDEEGKPLSTEELHDELATLLLAGHETTATGLSWALAWLASCPEVTARLVVELTGAGEDPEALTKLPYLNAVCNEALRVWPVFPLVMRVASEDWEGPAFVPKGWRAAPSIFLIHRRSDLYEDAHRFVPERFLDGTPPADRYFPFGGGGRRCIGAAFALYEMKLVLATLLRTVEIATDAAPPAPVRRNLAMAPRDTRIRVLRRR